MTRLTSRTNADDVGAILLAIIAGWGGYTLIQRKGAAKMLGIVFLMILLVDVYKTSDLWLGFVNRFDTWTSTKAQGWEAWKTHAKGS